MSQDKRHHLDFMKSVIEKVDKNPQDLHPVLIEFRDAIYADTRLWMLCNLMFAEIPKGKKYLEDPTGEVPAVRDFDHMLAVLNYILCHAPAWRNAGNSVGLVGVPVCATLDWSMGTTAGFAVFLDPLVNQHLKKILDVWGEFLQSPPSAEVLGDGDEGWFGETGRRNLEEVLNLKGQTNYSFEEAFHCQPDEKYHGYKSWNDFVSCVGIGKSVVQAHSHAQFTRTFREGIRPIASPEDDDILVNSCESRPFKIAHDVKRRDLFWAKGQPYSVVDMLAGDPLAEQFVGGTVYQAFLSALSYHRWHSPVSGTIKKAYIVPGTYFSEPLTTDPSQNDGLADMSENTAQEYISVMATRAIIFIEADNPKIGLMAFIAIGMVEVSTCQFRVDVGQRVAMGDQLGNFRFVSHRKLCLSECC